MSSSRQLSKMKNKNSLENDPRWFQPLPRGFTDSEKEILNMLPLPVDMEIAEKFFRKLPDSKRSYFPELGDPSRAQRRSSSSMMRYNDNGLEVKCGRGSMQYYQRDPDGTISVINVRTDEFLTYAQLTISVFRWPLLMMMNHTKWNTIRRMEKLQQGDVLLGAIF